jgi:hypothetical protein
LNARKYQSLKFEGSLPLDPNFLMRKLDDRDELFPGASTCRDLVNEAPTNSIQFATGDAFEKNLVVEVGSRLVTILSSCAPS